MEKFEKCTVAMLGGPCSQHVTGNTSRLNQPQSAIMSHTNTMTHASYNTSITTQQVSFKQFTDSYTGNNTISYHRINIFSYLQVHIPHNPSLTKCHKPKSNPMLVINTLAISVVRGIIASQWVVEVASPVHFIICRGKTFTTTKMSWQHGAYHHTAGNPP